MIDLGFISLSLNVCNYADEFPDINPRDESVAFRIVDESVVVVKARRGTGTFCNLYCAMYKFMTVYLGYQECMQLQVKIWQLCGLLHMHYVRELTVDLGDKILLELYPKLPLPISVLCSSFNSVTNHRTSYDAMKIVANFESDNNVETPPDNLPPLQTQTNVFLLESYFELIDHHFHVSLHVEIFFLSTDTNHFPS